MELYTKILIFSIENINMIVYLFLVSLIQYLLITDIEICLVEIMKRQKNECAISFLKSVNFNLVLLLYTRGLQRVYF